MKTLLASLLVLTSFSTFAKEKLYLAEQLLEITSIADEEKPYCISWANVGLADKEVKYKGHKGASYKCRVDFAYRERQGNNFGGEEKMASREVSYEAVPTVAKDRTGAGVVAGLTIGTALDVAATIYTFGIYGLVEGSLATEAITEGVNQLADIFTISQEEKLIRLTPKFKEIYNSMDMACSVLALELLASACEDSQSAIKNDIVKRIKATANLAGARSKMIPKVSN